MENMHEKYIVKNRIRPDEPDLETFVREGWLLSTYVDMDVLPGCNMAECGLKISATPADMRYEEHVHTLTDEVVFIFGTNVDHPHELYGEVEITFEGERHLVDRSCMLWIPKGMKHSVNFNRVDRPIHYAHCMTDACKYQADRCGFPEKTEEVFGIGDGQYGKHIIVNAQRTQEDPEWFKNPDFNAEGWRKIVYMDASIFPDANMCDSDWVMALTKGEGGHPEHYHPDADEMLCQFSSDLEDNLNFHGVTHWYLEGEDEIIDEPCLVWLPRGMKHGPQVVTERDPRYPSFGWHIMLGPGRRSYTSVPQT